MPLAYIVGKDAVFMLAASGTPTSTVLGVQNLSLDGDWESKKIMHIGDTAKTTIRLLKNWTITGTLTEDMTDTGQNFIRASYNTGAVKVSFMLYPGTATATTTTYSCTSGVVTKYSVKADPMSENQATFTIESDGLALTMPT
jgi:hypothetical protein